MRRFALFSIVALSLSLLGVPSAPAHAGGDPIFGAILGAALNSAGRVMMQQSRGHHGHAHYAHGGGYRCSRPYWDGYSYRRTCRRAVYGGPVYLAPRAYPHYSHRPYRPHYRPHYRHPYRY